MADTLPAVYAGNWLNAATHEWEYGLYEKFAVYDTDFWDYKKIENNRKETLVTLSRNGRDVELRLRKNKSGGIEIASGKGRYYDYRLARKGFGGYPSKDTTSFKLYQYVSDSVTILGYYRSMDKLPAKLRGKVFQALTYDFLADKQIPFYADIDSLGRCRLKVPVTGLNEIHLGVPFLRKKIYVEPGEKILFCSDILDALKGNNSRTSQEYWSYDRDILFMGVNSRLHNEMEYIPVNLFAGNCYSLRELKLTDTEVLKKQERYYLDYLDLFEKYKKQNPTLSDRCITLVENNALYEFAAMALQMRFELRNQGRASFTSGYMEYVKKMFPMDYERFYLIDYNFGDFIRNYTGYWEDQTGEMLPDGRMVKLALVQSGDVISHMKTEEIGTPEELLLMDRYINYQELLRNIPDSLSLNEIIEKNKDLPEKVSGFFKSDEYCDVRDWMLAKRARENYDTLLPAPYLKELELGRYYMKYLEKNRQALGKRMLSLAEESITIPGILACVKRSSEFYRKFSNKEVTYLESLKSSDHLTEFTDAKALFEKLTEPYKGCVIYLDIWGTWCDPCREQMAFTGAVKEALKGEKVIYMYLANRSDERTWKNLIREYDLTGDNVVHYRLPDEQQAMLERMLGISSFPTYMLLDKKGNIVNPKAPRPEQKDILVNGIRKLLKQE